MDRVRAQARSLAEQLVAMRVALQAECADAGVPDSEVVTILAAPLAALTKICIPDAHQKLDEIIFSAASKRSGRELKVQPQQHGADLRDAAGAAYELKVSVCSARGKRCNFNWNIPGGKNVRERRRNLLASVKTKTERGGAILIVRDGLGAELARADLTHAFLLEYFKHLPFTAKTTRHNMGCARCLHCHGFHRLERLQDASDRHRLAPRSIVWRDFFTQVASQCA